MRELPPDWELTTVSGIATAIISGGTPSRDVAQYWGGDIPWVTPGELTNLKGKYLADTAEAITSAGLAGSGARLLPPNALLVTTRATLGSVALTAGSMTTNQGFKSIAFTHRADPDFYYHLFATLKRELIRRASGTTFLEISGRQFAQIEVPLPPLAEQRKIAEVLDLIDEQIRTTRAMLSKYASQAEGVLDTLVSEASDVPQESLGALCAADICYGIVQSGEFVAGGIPVLSIRDVGGDFETGLHRTDPAIDAQYRRSRVAPGDVLLSIKGTIGRVGVAPEHYVGNISRELARLRFGRKILPEFARVYFLSREAQRRLDLAVVGTTRAEVSIHALKRFSVPVPSLVRQRRMVDAYRCVEERILAEERELLKLQALKLGLADDLLMGRVRVPAGAVS
ncbi:restriction endonuclease subunit S [Blastococcus capsensis]|uniref:restriction endonuclease subunit S n=1 Tax=Blastococcus capsensis TaxID=1564163 RepID=UPI00254002CE|nr:restriction endonuclease subunit S [Blastococcus capsensis]MDK3258171.1 restriction endonuclease subunit S [Blastococcus capsensis]